ncbi:HEAT repeat domain-containing protein [Cyanobium sp. ATX 6A2]|uniref:HEAT repeat domain-containing protein n=1 Tax=Cyanobium sp. ATX 6A2 TaxID=2823700 RepID=UPI0037C0C0C4
MSDELSMAPGSGNQKLSVEEANTLAAELRSQLREGLVPASDSEAIERMVAGLGDARGLMRLTFAESLGVVGGAAVPALCRALRCHENVTVRRAAAKTLTLIANPAALPTLLEALLADSDPVVQGSAVGAMAAVGELALDQLFSVLVHPEASAMQQGLASWGIAFIGAKAPEALRQAASSPDAGIRAAAVAALGDQIQALGDVRARQLLLYALDDPDTEVRAEAATLLGKLHEPEWACPRLLPLLTDAEEQVRKNAALSLMKLGAKHALPALQASVDREEHPDVRVVLELAINQLNR